MPTTEELFKAKRRTSNLWPKERETKQQKKHTKSQSLAVSVSYHGGPKAWHIVVLSITRSSWTFWL